MKVPMDWTNSTAGQITLSMSRIKASNPKGKVGSLLWNPGGPGGSASDSCQYFAVDRTFFSTAIYENFDIVCPDPRGVGDSTPVQCDPEIFNEMPSLFPKNETEFEQLLDYNKAFGDSCLNLTGPLLRHVDTTNAAKDIEAIRLALDDGKLNWLGHSYGSQLGGAYAELYPENIRAMVLDGAVDHSLTESMTLATMSVTYDAELVRFFDWCNTNSTCALHGQDVGKIFDSLVAEANRSPIPAPGCFEDAGGPAAGTCRPNVTGYEIISNTPDRYLTATKAWVGLGQALNETLSGNATLFSTFLQTETSSDDFSGIAIGCLDWTANATTFAENQALQQLGSVVAPHTLGANQLYQYSSWCVNWPVPVVNPQHWLNATNIAKVPSDTILIVNSDHDPETAYTWAQGQKDQIPNAVLLMRKGDGHTSYPLAGEATRLMDALLVNKTMPALGTVVDS